MHSSYFCVCAGTQLSNYIHKISTWQVHGKYKVNYQVRYMYMHPLSCVNWQAKDQPSQLPPYRLEFMYPLYIVQYMNSSRCKLTNKGPAREFPDQPQCINSQELLVTLTTCKEPTQKVNRRWTVLIVLLHCTCTQVCGDSLKCCCCYYCCCYYYYYYYYYCYCCCCCYCYCCCYYYWYCCC